MSRVEQNAVLALALALSACGPEQTPLSIALPEGAAPTRLELRVFEAEIDACGRLDTYGSSLCAESCPVDGPSWPELEPLAAIALEADAEGRIRGQVSIAERRPWSIVLVGFEDGAVSLLGCARVVSPGRELTLEARHAWCRSPRCEGAGYPAACRPLLTPSCQPALGFLDASGISCVAAAPDLESWSHEEISCPPEGDPYPLGSPCQSAVYVCEPGGDLTRELVCPQAEEPCVPLPPGDTLNLDFEMDIDCDGTLSICDSECEEGEVPRTACGVDGDLCVRELDCVEGQLVCRTVRSDERCDGLDNDCDGVVDGDGAVADCNARHGGSGERPTADTCRTGDCLCGTEDPCRVGLACCRGACVDLTEDASHCGACGLACRIGQRCAAGRCETPPGSVDAGMPECVTLTDCNRDSLVRRPRADLCVSGRCSCGGGPPCADREACCGGVCVTPDRNPAHCGGCDLSCTRTCVEGECT